MPVEIPETPHGHAAGPYSPVVRAGDWLALSGQVGIDPSTGRLVEGGAAAETRACLRNVEALLGDVGATLHDVVKVTVFLADIADWPAMNEAYSEVFADHRPARSAVGVGALPIGARVEIDVWAYHPRG